MLGDRKWDLLVILLLASLLVVDAHDDQESTTRVQSLPGCTARVDFQKVPVMVLRWSLTGGCYASAEYFFELRSDQHGADWTGLLCAHGGMAQLIERDGFEPPPQGNYIARGRLNEAETRQLIDTLLNAGALEVSKQFSSTGRMQALYFEVDGRKNKVAAFQVTFRESDTPGNKVSALMYSGLPSEVHKSLRERWERRESPDEPLGYPHQEWINRGLSGSETATVVPHRSPIVGDQRSGVDSSRE